MSGKPPILLGHLWVSAVADGTRVTGFNEASAKGWRSGEKKSGEEQEKTAELCTGEKENKKNVLAERNSQSNKWEWKQVVLFSEAELLKDQSRGATLRDF